MLARSTQEDLQRIRRLSWIGVFFFGFGLKVVPDWSDRHTIVGASIGGACFILLAAYSYYVQWRRRLTRKQLSQGLRQYRAMRAFAILPAAGLGIWIIYAVSGNNLEPYAKGAIFVFTFSLSVFALVNIYAKKGLFQQPNTKAPKTS